jgi:hypothetical protein
MEGKVRMKNKLLRTAAAIGLLAPTPSYADTALLAGVIWNGVTSTFVANFGDGPSCEQAFDAFKTDGVAKIRAARPGISFFPVFWHTCSPLSKPVPPPA